LSILIQYDGLYRMSATFPPPLDNVRRSDIFRLIALPPVLSWNPETNISGWRMDLL